MGVNRSVDALAVGRHGSVYAAGTFSTAGGTLANRIARWDGSAWHPLGNGMGGCHLHCVRSLAAGQDGSLYAGGVFALAGTRPSSSFARWTTEAGYRTRLPMVMRSQ